VRGAVPTKIIVCEVAMKTDGVTDQVMSILRGFSTLEWVLLAIGLLVLEHSQFSWGSYE